MPAAASTRLALIAPSGTDDLSLGDNVLAAIITQLEARVARIDQGLRSARPTADAAHGKMLYLSTDDGIVEWSTGTAWVPVAPGQVPVGGILAYAGTADPAATVAATYLLMDGRAISRTTYAGLWTLFGTTSSPHGQGNGTTTFNIPDGRGYAIAGLDNMLTAAGAAGRIAVASPRTIGKAAGSERVLLTAAQSGLRDHTHLMDQAGSTNSGNLAAVGGVASGLGPFTDNAPTKGVNGGALPATSDHQNLQPTLFLNYLIRVL